MPDWDDYQEEVAGFFRSLGLQAETNVLMDGVRTNHRIDVVVRSRHAGFDVLWIVECKAWNSAVPKEKVFALRSIVDDVGADRGFVMAERGYQAGALEAARYTNVLLTSIGDLTETLAYDLGMEKLRSLAKRVDSCRERYWSIDKSDRIELGLRPEVGAMGFMGDAVIGAVEHTLRTAFFRGFPIRFNLMFAALSARTSRGDDAVSQDDPDAIRTPSELFEVLHPELHELEERLDAAEAALASRSEGAR